MINTTTAGTVNVSATQVQRNGNGAVTYDGLASLNVNGTTGIDTFNVASTAAGTATTISAGTGLDAFGAIDLTQIGAAGLTIHGGGDGESLTLNTTTAGTVSVSATQVQRSGNGAVTYDGLSQLNVNGTNGVDIFQVSGTSISTTLDGKDGGDVYNITHTGLNGALNVADTGASGSDQLTDSSTAAGPETIGITSTQVTRSGGSQALTYSGLETLLVNGTTSGDTFNVTSTAAGTATTINAGTGLDNFGDIDLTQIGAAGLTIHGGGDGEVLTLNTTTAGTVAVSATQVQRSGNGTVSYDGLASLNVNGTAGIDTFNVASTAAGTTTTINADTGLDVFGAIDLTQIGAAGLTIHGGGDGELLTLNTTTAGTVAVSGTQVQRSGNGAVSYDGLASLNVNGTSGVDTFNVSGTSVSTNLDGKDSGDVYNVTHSGFGGPLNVADTGASGTDQLTDSSTGPGPESIGITSTQVTRSGGSQALTYSGLETLLVNGTNGGDQINVTSTAAGTATTISAGTGLDVFGPIDLTQIGAAGLTIHGGGDGEALTLNTTTAGTVNVSATQVQRNGNGPVNYDGFASLNVNGTTGVDTFNVASTAAGTATTISAGTGLDVFGAIDLTQIGAAGLTIHGGGDGEALTLNTTTAGTVNVSATQVQRNGNGAVAYDGLASLNVNGTSGVDTFNVASTAAGTATTISAGTGLDVFGAIDLTQIGAAGLTIHGGGDGEALTLNTTTAGTVNVSATQVQRSGNGAVTYDGLSQLNVNGTSGVDTFQVSGTSVSTNLDGKDSGDIYNVTHTGLGGPLNVADTGASGSDQLTDNSTAAGPETIGITSTQVTRSGGSQPLTYSGLETLLVNGTNGGDQINVASTASGTATTINAGTGLDVFGAIDLTQIGAAGLTIHAGSNGESLTLNTTTAGTVNVSATQVQRNGNGPVNYDGLTTLNVNGTTGIDTFNVASTAAGTATTISAGTGLDVFGAIDLTQIGAAGLTIHGGGDGEALTLNTTTAGTVNVSATQVQRSGNGPVSYDGLATLNVNGTNGVDMFNVASTAAGTATTISAGNGLDIFGAIDLTQIGAAGLTIHGGGDGESLTLNTTTAGTVNVSATQVQRNGNGPINYDGLAILNVNGTTGIDTFNVASTAAGTTTTINADTGLDVFGAIDLTQIGAAGLTIHGGGDGESLTLNTTTAGTVNVSDMQVQRSGNGPITYDGLASLNVNGTSGVDTFNVASTAAGVTTTLDGKASGDIYNVTQSGMAGPLFVTDSVPGGTNQLTSSTNSASTETIGISNNQITRSSGAAITYSGINVVIVNGSAQDDTIAVTSTISGSTTVNAGTGNDTITVGNACHKLDDILGTVTINGNDNVAPPVGGDRLIIDDSGQTTGRKYTLTDNKVTSSTGPVVNFGTIETLEVNSGSANDKFVVNFTSYPHTPKMTVKFNFGEALHATQDDLQINGTAGNDNILVGTTNSNLGEEFLLNDIDCLQMFGGNGNDVLVNDTEVSSLIDGGAGSDVLLGGNNVDVIFGGSQLAGQHDKDLIYGRGGNDILFADYDYNNGQPKVLHQSKNGDSVFGDDAPLPAVAAQYGLPNFAPGVPGIDTIVLIGSDSVSAGGQVGDTIIGTGLQKLTVIDWLRARFLKPTSKNIQDAINKAKQVECFNTTF